MKKAYFSIAILFPLFSLSGCDAIGAKTSSMLFIYATTAIASLLLLIGYCTLIKNKLIWFITLFASVFVVNMGYFCLSVSSTIEEALLANRISYLGSVMLPLSMLMLIIYFCNIKRHRFLVGLLITTSIIVFLIAASPGYLDIYYKSVTLETINGVTVLNKEYGSWHCIYLYYLLGYFGTMISIITYAIIKRKIDTPLQSIIIASAVFINIGIWFMEQLVEFDFEFLSISYIVSELFLLMLYLVQQENEKIFVQKSIDTHDAVLTDTVSDTVEAAVNLVEEKQISTADEMKSSKDEKEEFLKLFSTLTATEKNVFKMHIALKSTKEIIAELNITENTLKYHNKNLYSKLNVSSKKELREVVNSIGIKNID